MGIRCNWFKTDDALREFIEHRHIKLCENMMTNTFLIKADLPRDFFCRIRDGKTMNVKSLMKFARTAGYYIAFVKIQDIVDEAKKDAK